MKLKQLPSFDFLNKWINNNENLLLLQKRLSKNIPKSYLKSFYRIWVYGHLIKRISFFSKTNPLNFTPLTAKISPTLNCNLKCKGCFAGSYPDGKVMSFNDMIRIIEEGLSVGIPSYGVIGGEPLLVPYLFNIFKQFDKTGFYLVTNGTIVTPEVVRQLKKLPNVVTIFSIEGFKSTNDYLRGHGVFDKIIGSMKLMKEAGLIFGFSTVVTRQNRQEVISNEYIDYMIDQGCCIGGFLPYIPVGTEPFFQNVCTPDEVMDYFKMLDKLTWDKPILIMKEGYSDSTFMNKGCIAAHTIHITSLGEAEPCNGIEFYTDTIFNKSLKDIYKSDFFSDIRQLHLHSGHKCLTNNFPQEIIMIIEKHKAKPTHENAMEHLVTYAAQKEIR